MAEQGGQDYDPTRLLAEMRQIWLSNFINSLYGGYSTHMPAFNQDAQLDPSQVEDRRPFPDLNAYLEQLKYQAYDVPRYSAEFILKSLFGAPPQFAPSPDFHDQTYYPASDYQYFEDNSRQLLPPPAPVPTPAPDYHDNSYDTAAAQQALAAMVMQSMAAPSSPPPPPPSTQSRGRMGY